MSFEVGTPINIALLAAAERLEQARKHREYAKANYEEAVAFLGRADWGLIHAQNELMKLEGLARGK